MNLIDFSISFVLLALISIKDKPLNARSTITLVFRYKMESRQMSLNGCGFRLMTIVRKGFISCHFSVFGLDPQDHLLVSCDNQVVPRGAPSYSDAICRPSAVRQYLLTGLPDTCSYRTWCSGCHPYCFKACGKGQAILLCSKCSQLNVP